MKKLTVFFYTLLGYPLKVVIGSGGFALKGWLATDKDNLDVTSAKDFENLFKRESVKALLAEHVWEHLAPGDAEKGLENCYSYLKHGGHIRIAVPDGLHPSKGYIDKVKPGGSGAGAWDHKVLYTHKTLTDLLEGAGFTVNLVEYFDENGEFHKSDWDIEDGFVKRSLAFAHRNWNGGKNYTSLIIDGIKI